MAVLKGYIKANTYNSELEADEAYESLIKKTLKATKIARQATEIRVLTDGSSEAGWGLTVAKVTFRGVDDSIMQSFAENMAEAMQDMGDKGYAIFYNPLNIMNAYILIIALNKPRFLDNYGYNKGDYIIYV